MACKPTSPHDLVVVRMATNPSKVQPYAMGKLDDAFHVLDMSSQDMPRGNPTTYRHLVDMDMVSTWMHNPAKV